MTSRHFLELLEIQTTRERSDALLRARFRHDRGGFLRWCLPEVFAAPFNPFHRQVLSAEKLHWRDLLVDDKRLNLAPRGIGKSTIKKGDVAHSIAYGLRRFIAIVCATQRDAKGWAATIKEWFSRPTDGTQRLHELYGPFVVSGEKQRFTVTGPRGSCTILCTSVNTSVQGENELTHRPDELILDDWEDRKKVRSATVRQSWERKLNEEFAKLGDRRRGMVTDSCVTINHSEAPSAKIRRQEKGFAGWQVHEFPAIYSWPERADLWEQCGRVFLNLALGSPRERYSLAKRFYQAKRAEMDRGAEILDRVLLPLFDCYVMIWQEGLAAFLREMQHVEHVNLDGLFNSSTFARCKVIRVHGELAVVNAVDGRVVRRSEMVKAIGRWDWASGVPGGDYAALAIILRDAYGYGYVVDGWMKRAKTSEQVQAAWYLCEKWQIPRLSVETNQGQSILVDQTWPTSVKERQKLELWTEAVAFAEPSTGNKEADIASLEPAITGQLLQFADALPPEGMAQFDAFDGIANSHNDDFEDVIARGWQLTGGMPPRMGQARIWG